MDGIKDIRQNGVQLLLDPIYDAIGFNRIKDDLLRQLVIARVAQPRSKLATVDYLRRYFDAYTTSDNIYRYMDKLYDTQRELVQQISMEHTRKVLGGRLGIVFYDVTTLYFETARKDSLRSPGFSKDGKTTESQVVLGLLVSEGGYPLSYSLFLTSSLFSATKWRALIISQIQKFPGGARAETSNFATCTCAKRRTGRAVPVWLW